MLTDGSPSLSSTMDCPLGRDCARPFSGRHSLLHDSALFATMINLWLIIVGLIAVVESGPTGGHGNPLHIGRLTPRADGGFVIRVGLVPSEPFWLCVGYVPSNATHHHKFRWDRCGLAEGGDEATLDSENGFAYALNALWPSADRFAVRFWRNGTPATAALIVGDAQPPTNGQLIVGHRRTAIRPTSPSGENGIGEEEATKNPDTIPPDVVTVMSAALRVQGLDDHGVIVAATGRGVASLEVGDD